MYHRVPIFCYESGKNAIRCKASCICMFEKQASNNNIFTRLERWINRLIRSGLQLKSYAWMRLFLNEFNALKLWDSKTLYKWISYLVRKLVLNSYSFHSFISNFKIFRFKLIYTSDAIHSETSCFFVCEKQNSYNNVLTLSQFFFRFLK